MKIGIDARLINETGVGRYIQNLLKWLNKLDKVNEYIVFTYKNSIDFPEESTTWKVVQTDIRWHTLQEQLVFPFLLNKYNLDLIHFPYFSMPILYSGKFIVTIHDLTNLNFSTGKASTLPPYLYKIKFAGYSFVLNNSLRRSEKIIVPSQSVASDIISRFPDLSHKVIVTYEGGMETTLKLSKKLDFEPFLLYVGNLYPHKNIEIALNALKKFNQQNNSKIKLAVVGEKDAFYKRTVNLVNGLVLEKSVIFLGQVSDLELSNLYQRAICLLFPSISEGFGLPIIEALQHGCLVCCSDIGVFREIYGNIPFYFNPYKAESIVNSLEKIILLSEKEKTLLKNNSKTKSRQFNWKIMSEKTLSLYKEAVK